MIRKSNDKKIEQVDATLGDVRKQSHDIAENRKEAWKAIDPEIHKRARRIAQSLMNPKNRSKRPIK